MKLGTSIGLQTSKPFQGDAQTLSLSVIIVDTKRSDACRTTIECLRFTEADIEIILIETVSSDALLSSASAEYGDDVHVLRSADPRISALRNKAVSAATGDIIVFMPAGTLPCPDWAAQLCASFESSTIVCLGIDIVAEGYSAPLATYMDRLGYVCPMQLDDPSFYDTPFTYILPTISSFHAVRRSALLIVSGYDERYTSDLCIMDLCCRLIDKRFTIKRIQLEMWSASPFDRQQNFRDQVYFAVKNNRGYHNVARLLQILVERCDPTIYNPRELLRGLADGLREEETTLPLAEIPATSRLQLRSEVTRDVFVFVSQQYPPATLGGIGRNIHELARAVAKSGHQVHVLTKGHEHDSLTFEEGVWVHRLAPVKATQPNDLLLPPHIWANAITVLAGVAKISRYHRIVAVHAPIWDVEGIAVLLDGRFPLVLALQTPLKFWLDHHALLSQNEAFYGAYATQMIAAETLLLEKSLIIHANSKAIARDIEMDYAVDFGARLRIVHHSLMDWRALMHERPAEVPNGSVRLLFTGRLEWRKGIDVLLDVLPDLLETHPTLHVDIVGDDTIVSEHGSTYRTLFEQRFDAHERGRVRFHGLVDDEVLRGYYEASDVVVAPSRYESFGMILVEAMMYAKPCVACCAGGMSEVVEDGTTGLLAKPGDISSLRQCLDTLIGSPALRQAMGLAGRTRYETKFSKAAIASGIVDMFRSAREGHDIPDSAGR